MELQFRKPSFRYKAGQWLFLNVPSVSPNQWHPFTITSCPFDDHVSVHIRQVGDWTRELANALGAGNSQADLYDDLDELGMYDVQVALSQGEKMPTIRIDGPYGAPAEDVFQNEIAILIGTGIGVTPWASILKNVWHLRHYQDPKRRLRRVEFIWVCKDTTSFEWFQALLLSLETQAMAEAAAEGYSGNEFLRINTYLTQRTTPDMAQNIILNSVGQDRDPLTQLTSRTNFGRPDFNKVFKDMRDGILNQSYGKFDRQSTTNIGVYFCGPAPAARDIKKACKAATVNDVRFHFWKEHF